MKIAEIVTFKGICLDKSRDHHRLDTSWKRLLAYLVIPKQQYYCWRSTLIDRQKPYLSEIIVS